MEDSYAIRSRADDYRFCIQVCFQVTGYLALAYGIDSFVYTIYKFEWWMKKKICKIKCGG
jgi:hypothetical protein